MADEEVNRPLKTARIIHILFLVTIIIYLDILRRDFITQFFLEENTLDLVMLILIIFGFVGLAYGCFLPRLMIKGYRKKPRLERGNFLLSIILVRAAMFEAIAIWGLILRVVGISLQIVWPFFLVSALALILTFPTKARLEKMLLQISRPQY